MVYEMTLLSQVKLSESLSDEELEKEFRMQFGLVVPMSHVDCVFVTGLDQEKNDPLKESITSDLKSIKM